MMSAPAPPLIMLLPEFPKMVLLRPLPVASMFVDPLKVRASTLAGRVKETELDTVSISVDTVDVSLTLTPVLLT